MLKRVLARLAARGFVTTPDESPRRMAQRLDELDHPGANDLRRFLMRYEALRFGPSGPRDDIRALDNDMRAALDAIRLLRPPSPAP